MRPCLYCHDVMISAGDTCPECGNVSGSLQRPIALSEKFIYSEGLTVIDENPNISGRDLLEQLRYPEGHYVFRRKRNDGDKDLLIEPEYALRMEQGDTFYHIPRGWLN